MKWQYLVNKKSVSEIFSSIVVAGSSSLIGIVFADEGGCSGPRGWKLNDKYGVAREDLKLPAYFYVGAGYFVIHDADGLGNDAKGFMASVKAYPVRQHYAEKLKSEDDGTKKVSEAITEAAKSNDAKGSPKSTEQQQADKD